MAPDSTRDLSSPLKVGIDNWRWAGVPIYLRTGKKMAEGMRIISIAFKEAPRTMFPPARVSGSKAPTTSPSTWPTTPRFRCRSRKASGAEA